MKLEVLQHGTEPAIVTCLCAAGLRPYAEPPPGDVELLRVEQKMTETDMELKRAMELMNDALAALRKLDKKDVQELKGLSKPPCEVAAVGQAYCVIVNGPGSYDWKTVTAAMCNPREVIDRAMALDPSHMTKRAWQQAHKMVKDWSVEDLKKKSVAAAGLLQWELAMINYGRVYIHKVLPSLLASTTEQQMREVKSSLLPADDSSDEIVFKYGDAVQVLDEAETWICTQRGWLPLFDRGECCFAWDPKWQTQNLSVPDASSIADLQQSIFADSAHLSLFSYGKEKFSSSQALCDISLQEDAALLCTDFIELCPHGKASKIAATEMRGVSLNQLQKLLIFLRKRCNPEGVVHGWRDLRTGDCIMYDSINLYQLNSWIVMPATDAFTCSYVELVTTDPESQKPLWFISHAWSEPVPKFVQCVSEHFRLRHLSKNTAVWVCAYANNQHELGTDLVANPEKTSFFRAMRISIGVLLILDDLATPFQRIWCCFEESVAVTDTQRSATMLLDIAIVHDGCAHVITDGVAPEDVANRQSWRGEEDEWRIKGLRENIFPNDLVVQAITNIEIENASATQLLDKHRILNSVAKRPEHELDLHPESSHPRYDEVNRVLRAIFAVAAWPQAARKRDTDTLSSLAATLLADDKRKSLHLSFNFMMTFDNANMVTLARALPPNLEHLAIEMQFCKDISSAGIAALADRLPSSLQHISLNLADCTQVLDEDVAVIAHALPRGLRALELNLSRCLKIGLTGRYKAYTKGLCELAERLPESLRCLHLTLRSCLMITNEEISLFAKALPDELEELVLDFAGCHHVSSGGADALRNAIPASVSNFSLDGGKTQSELHARTKPRNSAQALKQTPQRASFSMQKAKSLNQSKGKETPQASPKDSHRSTIGTLSFMGGKKAQRSRSPDTELTKAKTVAKACSSTESPSSKNKTRQPDSPRSSAILGKKADSPVAPNTPCPTASVQVQPPHSPRSWARDRAPNPPASDAAANNVAPPAVVSAASVGRAQRLSSAGSSRTQGQAKAASKAAPSLISTSTAAASAASGAKPRLSSPDKARSTAKASHATWPRRSGGLRLVPTWHLPCLEERTSSSPV